MYIFNVLFPRCQSGCSEALNQHNSGYNCIDSNEIEKWEFGENTFNYTFHKRGKFVVGYVSHGSKSKQVVTWACNKLYFSMQHWPKLYNLNFLRH